MRFLLALVSLFSLSVPARAQIPPEDLHFVHEYETGQMLGGNGSTGTLCAIDKFDGSLGTLVYVEIEVTSTHERTSLAVNWDNVASFAWFGNDVGDGNDCTATSKLRTQVPSGTFLNDCDGSYPYLYFDLDPFDDDQATQFDGDVQTTRLRHASEWTSYMVGSSGTWNLTGVHTGTIGYGDPIAGGACMNDISEDWCVGTCSPSAAGIGYSALDNVYADVHVTYAYTTP